jgi:putative sigma-54 modulation protein
MRLQVKAHKGHVSDRVYAYAEKRLTKLDRRLYEGTLVEVTLERLNNPSIRDDHVAEGVVHAKGSNIVAREAAESYEAAIDRLVDKLERQIERYRDKRTHEPRRASQRAGKAVEAAVEEAPEPEAEEVPEPGAETGEEAA